MAADKAHRGSALVIASAATRTSGGSGLMGEHARASPPGFCSSSSASPPTSPRRRWPSSSASIRIPFRAGRADGGRSQVPAWRRWCSYDIGSVNSVPTRGFLAP